MERKIITAAINYASSSAHDGLDEAAYDQRRYEGFLEGVKYASKLWVDLNDELPEDEELVLVRLGDDDCRHPHTRYALAVMSEGAWYFIDEDFEDCTPTHFLRFPRYRKSND